MKPDRIENLRLKREMLRLASDFAGGDEELLHRYIVTREELKGLSLPVQNELLSAQVETLRDVLSAKKRKAPEPASGDDAPGELRPLAGFCWQQPPATYLPRPQQAPAAYQQQPSPADRISAAQQQPAAHSQQQHPPQQPPAGFPHQPPPCSSGPDIRPRLPQQPWAAWAAASAGAAAGADSSPATDNRDGGHISAAAVAARIYLPQQPPAAHSQQPHPPQQPPARFPQQPPPCADRMSAPAAAGRKFAAAGSAPAAAGLVSAIRAAVLAWVKCKASDPSIQPATPESLLKMVRQYVKKDFLPNSAWPQQCIESRMEDQSSSSSSTILPHGYVHGLSMERLSTTEGSAFPSMMHCSRRRSPSTGGNGSFCTKRKI
jgi:hypothetical protein